MYIGPWQEFRLAKLQKETLNRIQQDWGEAIRESFKDEDEEKIRDVMDRVLNKLPSKNHPRMPTLSRTSKTSSSKIRNKTDYMPPSQERKKPSTQNNMQRCDTKGRNSAFTAGKMKRPIKKKKKKKTVLEEASQRRKLYTKWLKPERNIVDEANMISNQEVEPPISSEVEVPIKFPQIHSNSHVALDLKGGKDTQEIDKSIRNNCCSLPSIERSCNSNGYKEKESIPESLGDDSVDEDEMDDLIKWTQNLTDFDYDDPF